MADKPAEHPARIAVAEVNPEALFMDGYDDAICGVAMRFGMNEVAAYDYDKVIGTMVEDGMSEEAAVEFFNFNQIGAWLGENTPVFVTFLSLEKQKSSS